MNLKRRTIIHTRSKESNISFKDKTWKEVRYHYIRHLLEIEVLQFEKIFGNENPADMFTKIARLEKLKL